MDPLGPLGLPRTKADEIAATIPEITSGSNRISTSRTLKSSSGKPSQNTAGEWASVGLEDEDMALQAALYASVLGQPESTPASASIAEVRVLYLAALPRDPEHLLHPQHWLDLTKSRWEAWMSLLLEKNQTT
jgi:hypothetical protein